MPYYCDLGHIVETPRDERCCSWSLISRSNLKLRSSPRPWSKRCRSTGCAGSTDSVVARGVRSGPQLEAASPGGGAARAVRCAAVSLRHAQAVVPEEPHDRRGGQIV